MGAARSAKLQQAVPFVEQEMLLLLPREEPPGKEDRFPLWRLPWRPVLRQGQHLPFSESLRCRAARARGMLGQLIRPICITILYHNLLLFIDIFHI
jgi:hypothetical protein